MYDKIQEKKPSHPFYFFMREGKKKTINLVNCMTKVHAQYISGLITTFTNSSNIIGAFAASFFINNSE